MKNKQRVNLHLSSALPSKLKRGNHETSIWWDKLGHAQRPAKPGLGFQMEPEGNPQIHIAVLQLLLTVTAKMIVVWLLRGFPPSVFLFSGGETQQLQIPEGHVDLQRKQLSPNSLWNHPYISIVRGNWVMSSCQAYGRQSWRAITLSLYALAQTHFNTLFANKAKCFIGPASCPVTADKGIRTCVNQAAENGWADITLHPFPVLWCKQRVGRYWMEIYINLHKTQSNICATFVQNLDFMTAGFLSCSNLHFFNLVLFLFNWLEWGIYNWKCSFLWSQNLQQSKEISMQVLVIISVSCKNKSKREHQQLTD